MNNKTKDYDLNPSSLKTAFEEEDKEFELDSDTSDIPELDILEDDEDDNSTPALLARQNGESSTGSSIDLQETKRT